MDGRIEAWVQRNKGLIGDFIAMAQAQGEANPMLAMLAPLTLDRFIEPTGIYAIKGFGQSSKRQGDSFINRTFLYVPEEATGFVKAAQVPARPFDGLAYASASTTLFVTLSVDITAWHKATERWLHSVVGDIGTNLYLSKIAERIHPEAQVTWQSFLEGGPMTLTVVAGPTGETFSVNQERFNYDFPVYEVFVAATTEGREAFFEAILEGTEDLEVLEGSTDIDQWYLATNTGKTKHFVPVLGHDPVAGNVYFSSRPEAMATALGRPDGLRGQAAFKQVTEALPTQGHYFGYASQSLIQVALDLKEAVMQQAPEARFAFAMYGLFYPILSLDKAPLGVAATATQTDSGLLMVGYEPFVRSVGGLQNQQQTFVTTGLMAAMAIPAFNKVRDNARIKSVTNNLRMVAAGGQQYLLEEGTDQVSYQTVVQAGYFSALEPVHGESYQELTVDAEGGTLSVTLKDGTEVSYDY
jgi:type IV pilus assembly protein PilA